MRIWLGGLVTCAMLAAAGPSAAQAGAKDGWDVSGSIRVRYEAIGDQFRPAPTARNDDMLSLRTTLLATYSQGAVHFGGELFDSRAYGQSEVSSAGTTEVNALEVGQAYLAFDLGGSKPTSTLTLGRFTMDDGSRRLIARNQFRNTINAFTGLRWDWKQGGDTARLFWTMPQLRRPTAADDIRDNVVQLDRESPDLQFFGGSYTHRLKDAATIEGYVYGLTERDSPAVATRNRRLVTTGVRLARAPKKGQADFDLEGVYQLGHERGSTRATDRTDLEVSAWFVHAEAGRTFTGPWAPRIAAQLDVASGDDGDPGHFHRFDTLFGARRGEYGPTSLWGAVQRANLVSPALRLEVAPDPRWDAFGAVRGLWLENRKDSFAATGVRDANGRSGRYAGAQAEARLRYWLVPRQVRLEGGAAWLFKGRFLQDAPNAPQTGDSRYGYVDVTYTF